MVMSILRFTIFDNFVLNVIQSPIDFDLAASTAALPSGAWAFGETSCGVLWIVGVTGFSDADSILESSRVYYPLNTTAGRRIHNNPIGSCIV